VTRRALVACHQEERFEWHQTSASSSSARPLLPTAQRDQALRQSMFNLVKGRFAERLLANARGSYPRGSFDCLRAFAFWVSFVRHEFCRDRQLVLSPEALSALQQWVRRCPLLLPRTHHLIPARCPTCLLINPSLSRTPRAREVREFRLRPSEQV
jgi:hypothetical protein